MKNIGGLCGRSVCLFFISSEISQAISVEQRMGLRTPKPTDEKDIVEPFLKFLETYKMDFHSAFRALSRFNPIDGDSGKFAKKLLPDPSRTSSVAMESLTKGREELKEWLGVYSARILEEKPNWEKASQEDKNWIAVRAAAMDSVNPRFVLRQWVLEEVIKKCETDLEGGKRVLGKVMEVRHCLVTSSHHPAHGGMEDVHETVRFMGRRGG